MTKQKRTVFYLSDRTGITAETLGHSLLTQFDGIEWETVNVPFLDDLDKARAVLIQINHATERDGYRPLVFSTLLKPEILEVIKQTNCRVFDFFETFINPIEQELNLPFARMAGRSHGLQHHLSYFKRIAAINYVLAHDDGVNPKNFDHADIVLIGISRSGKTPTCLYLGLQYGIAAANYPLTEEDMSALQLPTVLENFRNKIFGLTLSAAQLHFIREERRPNSRYASLAQCQQEISWQESLFQQCNIPYLDTTHISIEEISAIILNRCGLKRQLYG
ncbi:putative phosphoenolpyruvate synthase regulatory protein [Nitrosomonas sp. PY1]|uniref:posphoenolpyruvate synthetase regulatory kinase/phosphorylase PpsR n=1 Tax=Nitrosomonas sp. PY1 TaxID=1803906 RepID=UPI001FC8D962|nr:pyruvate, water dikinase regulatory protein [Nitrosomonas sp. PY1]GKS69425.1 putative phosphoenolpyruvate synthase regulatory protein [Nitrosomonas sp. PY1]